MRRNETLHIIKAYMLNITYKATDIKPYKISQLFSKMLQKLMWGSLGALIVVGLALLLWLSVWSATAQDSSPYASSQNVWAYRCETNTNTCVKVLVSSTEIPVKLSSRSVCKLQCGSYGNLWPLPNGQVTIGDKLAAIDVNLIYASKLGAHAGSHKTLRSAFDYFRLRQKSKLKLLGRNNAGNTKVRLLVHVNISEPNELSCELRLDTNESYTLKVDTVKGGTVRVTIKSENFFGARHALETLDQLIVVDDLYNAIQIPIEVNITDQPSYPYRGILIDTVRSFITVDALKRTIDAMGASKLNTLHWHITDSQSFPFESKSFPQLTRLGAYSHKHVYTEKTVGELIEYARIRGVRIIPEFDAPAHVGEGWDFAPETLVCFKHTPWKEMCGGPPCGQLDPTNHHVYEILGGIYADMIRSFHPVAFHMGSDEVNFKCWNTSKTVQLWLDARNMSNSSDDSFLELWNNFQTRALEKLDSANEGKEIPVIIWTNSMTSAEKVESYLDPRKYIIQVWTGQNDPVIRDLAYRQYQMIFSNYDTMHLDCRYSSWYGNASNNWCLPYIGWQKFYDNDPRTLLRNQGVTDSESLSLALGGEAAMWTEQADSSSIDIKIWPRAAAMAERLWSDPPSNWKSAVSRFLEHRERLVNLGISPDSIQPQWCLNNEDQCI